ncbi:uncharacterized protein VP01_4250g1 [Puccinia sorghi]|uniref:Uncharacterized protein n=1 Tax=Puccinia sorghi TaxID=27349 RepID=A0A0L6USD3_9BASI|nr:uncharacterized protein VP01_4250g1 [Puccinia sorghi]
MNYPPSPTLNQAPPKVSLCRNHQGQIPPQWDYLHLAQSVLFGSPTPRPKSTLNLVASLNQHQFFSPSSPSNNILSVSAAIVYGILIGHTPPEIPNEHDLALELASNFCCFLPI